MAEAQAIVETSVQLRLTEKEAKWLFGMTQNDLTQGQETPEEYQLRSSIFQALHTALVRPASLCGLFDPVREVPPPGIWIATQPTPPPFRG